jgi:multidrug efflux pump subunit AcrA (membrane-fusion protein)
MAERNWRLGLLAVGVGVALAGCLPKALNPEKQGPPAEAGTNTPPNISGTPVATATLDDTYEFVPVAEDPDGQPLS